MRLASACRIVNKLQLELTDGLYAFPSIGSHQPCRSYIPSDSTRWNTCCPNQCTKGKIDFPTNKPKLSLLVGYMLFVNRYPSTLLLIRFIRQYQIQHSLAYLMNQAKSILPLNKPACPALPACTSCKSVDCPIG
jgi:hypothetical protein